MILYKNMLATLAILLSTQATFAHDLDEGSAEMAAKYEDMSPAGIQKLIREEIQSICEDGLCRIYGVETKTNARWDLSFFAGEGTQNASNGQNVYYIGTSPTNNNDNRYVGMQLTVHGPVTCQTTVKVDPSVFRLVKSFMYNTVKEDGRVPRDLTDAEKTVMMFYGKIIDKAAACTQTR